MEPSIGTVLGSLRQTSRSGQPQDYPRVGLTATVSKRITLPSLRIRPRLYALVEMSHPTSLPNPAMIAS